MFRLLFSGWFLVAALALTIGPAEAASRTVIKVGDEEVVILRDGYGIPHVFAPSERAVYYGNGYAVAQDRLAQLEKYRRTARGEMAELVGTAAVEADRETRREGYTEAERETQLRRLPQPLQAMFQAYADGINAFITETTQKGVPAEVQKLGVPIRPWKPTDSIAIGQMMARRFGGDDGGELRNLQVFNLIKLKFGDQAMGIFNDLLWKNDPAAPTTISAEESRRATNDERPTTNDQRRLAEIGRSVGQNPPQAPAGGAASSLVVGRSSLVDPAVLAAAIRSVAREPQMELALRYGLPTRWGSYAIAVAPKKSASGNAILIGGPQMGFMTPQIAHEVHLVAPPLNAIGMGFAGIPGVLIGRNEHLAWSTTTGNGDQTDIFVEELNPANKRQYKYKSEWKAMEKRTETIAVRGGAPVTMEVFRTIHGPVVSFDEAANRAYAQSSTYWEHENDNIDAIYDLNRAQNIKEFGAAAAKFTTSHNWLCATQDGDIGYWFVGKAPVRADGLDARFPTPGTGEYDWKGVRRFEEMPQIVNPKQGFLANWNNKPAVWWENSDTPVWGAIFRVQRIFDRLAEKPLLTLEDVKSILPDIGTNEPTAAPFKPFLLEAVRQAGDGADARLKEAAHLIEAWDNHAVDGSVAKTIFDAWMRELRGVIFNDEIGTAMVPPDIERALQPSLILHVLEGKKASIPLSRDYMNGKSAAEVCLDALKKAIERLTQERSAQMSLWTYKQPRTRFDPLPDIPAYNRGTYLFIAELTKPQIQSESVLPPGQSEDPASPHFGDQRELTSLWQYKPLITDKEALEKLVPAAEAAP